MSHGQMGFLALDGSLPRDGASIKTLAVVPPHQHCSLNEQKMPEIRNNPNTVHQWGPGCYHVTARKELSKEVRIVVMECYYRANPIDENGVPVKGYRKRMYREWLQQGPFADATEQRICDQANAIRKKMDG